MQVLNDSGPQSLSREFKRFANEWNEHVASSLSHPIAWPRKQTVKPALQGYETRFWSLNWPP